MVEVALNLATVACRVHTPAAASNHVSLFTLQAVVVINTHDKGMEERGTSQL